MGTVQEILNRINTLISNIGKTPDTHLLQTVFARYNDLLVILGLDKPGSFIPHDTIPGDSVNMLPSKVELFGEVSVIDDIAGTCNYVFVLCADKENEVSSIYAFNKPSLTYSKTIADKVNAYYVPAFCYKNTVFVQKQYSKETDTLFAGFGLVRYFNLSTTPFEYASDVYKPLMFGFSSTYNGSSSDTICFTAPDISGYPNTLLKSQFYLNGGNAYFASSYITYNGSSFSDNVGGVSGIENAGYGGYVPLDLLHKYTTDNAISIHYGYDVNTKVLRFTNNTQVFDFSSIDWLDDSFYLESLAYNKESDCLACIFGKIYDTDFSAVFCDLAEQKVLKVVNGVNKVLSYDKYFFLYKNGSLYSTYCVPYDKGALPMNLLHVLGSSNLSYGFFKYLSDVYSDYVYPQNISAEKLNGKSNLVPSIPIEPKPDEGNKPELVEPETPESVPSVISGQTENMYPYNVSVKNYIYIGLMTNAPFFNIGGASVAGYYASTESGYGATQLVTDFMDAFPFTSGKFPPVKATSEYDYYNIKTLRFLTYTHPIPISQNVILLETPGVTLKSIKYSYSVSGDNIIGSVSEIVGSYTKTIPTISIPIIVSNGNIKFLVFGCSITGVTTNESNRKAEVYAALLESDGKISYVNKQSSSGLSSFFLPIINTNFIGTSPTRYGYDFLGAGNSSLFDKVPFIDVNGYLCYSSITSSSSINTGNSASIVSGNINRMTWFSINEVFSLYPATNLNGNCIELYRLSYGVTGTYGRKYVLFLRNMTVSDGSYVTPSVFTCEGWDDSIKTPWKLLFSNVFKVFYIRISISREALWIVRNDGAIYYHDSAKGAEWKPYCTIYDLKDINIYYSSNRGIIIVAALSDRIVQKIDSTFK